MKNPAIRFHSYLVDHHYSQKVTDGSKEKTVQVVLDTLADGVAEDIQDHLSNHEEEYTKGDVAQRPAVLKCPYDQQNLAAKVDEQHNGVDDVGNNKDTDGVLVAQAGPVLEGEKRHSAGNKEHGEGAEAQ